MHRRAIALTVFSLFVGLSGCSLNVGGLLDAAAVELASPAEGVKALATADEQDPCPDLSDATAPTEVYLCQLAIRVLYNLGFYATCQEYIDDHNACTVSS